MLEYFEKRKIFGSGETSQRWGDEKYAAVIIADVKDKE